MQDEADFLRAALAAPQDDNLRLVYADWLDEQDDPSAPSKAEFLRLLSQPPGKPKSKPEIARQARLKELAATLDTNWAAAVSKLAVENCQKKPEPGGFRGRMPIDMRIDMRLAFRLVCDRRWEDLTPTDDRGVRHCGGCGENVHFCDTITDARTHAFAGHCIAVDLGVIRRNGDLEPPMAVAGMLSPDYWKRQEELNKPDPVSAERERRKKAARPE